MNILPFERRRHDDRGAGAALQGTTRASIAPQGLGAAEEPLVELRGIRKSFIQGSGIVSADLEVRPGEIHAIVGANGSGKTTLANIVAGIYAPDAGEMRIAGRKVRFASPRDAQRYGIVTIHQEPQFVPGLTVADNIFLGAELVFERIPLMHRHQMRDRATDLLRELGASFDAATPVAKLGLAERQIVAIARALIRNVRLCILDEPTAALGSVETARLFEVLRHLRDRGAGVIYISHKLDEVLTIADRVTIMRSGTTTEAIRVAEVTRESLISQFVMRVGAGEQAGVGVLNRPGRSVALQVEHLSRRNIFEDVSFEITAGEIYGLAGLTGSGRTRIARAIFGVDPLDGGLIRVYGRSLRIRSPRDAIKAGIGMLTEDREVDGLILRQPASANVALPIWDRIAHAGLVTPGIGLRMAARLIAQLGVCTPVQSCAVQGLSGGNQQKVVLAKWFATLPKVLILDEPMRGVDVTAKMEICSLIRYLAAQGIGLLVICSELPELLNVADRVGVVRKGRIVAEFSRSTATQELVFQHALGTAGRAAQGADHMVVQSTPRRPAWPADEADLPGMGLQPCQ